MLAAARFKRFPRWLKDPIQRKLVLDVYDAYIKRTPVHRICEQFNITYNTVYTFIEQARSISAQAFADDLAHVVHEQIEARRRIIEQARDAIRLLMPPDPTVEATPLNSEALLVSGYDEEYTPNRRRTPPPLQQSLDPRSGKSIASLLDVISSNEYAIEELVRLRDPRGRPSNGVGLPSLLPGEDPQSDQADSRRMVVIDVTGGRMQIPDGAEFVPATVQDGRIVVEGE